MIKVGDGKRLISVNKDERILPSTLATCNVAPLSPSTCPCLFYRPSACSQRGASWSSQVRRNQSVQTRPSSERCPECDESTVWEYRSERLASYAAESPAYIMGLDRLNVFSLWTALEFLSIGTENQKCGLSATSYPESGSYFLVMFEPPPPPTHSSFVELSPSAHS